MTTPETLSGAAPGWRKLLATTVAAMLVAAAVVVMFVLPAEYGIDPTGTGRLLGLTAIADSADAAAGTAATPLDGDIVQSGPVTHARATPMADVREFVLDPYQYVEYKYRLERGASFVFSWSASTPVIYDMHGESDGVLRPDEPPPPEPTSYDKGTKANANGAFTAPFTGIHGWYWENPGGEPVTVTIRSTGLYAHAMEIRSPRNRRSHGVTPIDQVSVPRVDDSSSAR